MNFEKLENLMEHFVEEGYAPGNTIKVFLGGKKVFDYTCGYSDLENKIKMTGKEYLNLYSASKVATVTAALQLVENGTMLLTDPLYEYIPEYKDMYIKKENGEIVKAEKDIKILNLFNMTAGFTYNTDTDGIRKAREITNGKMNTEVVIRCMAEDPLAFEPGDQFKYSMCHDVLAGLVEIVSGKKFRDYVKENIFDPLDMKYSVYHLTPEIEEKMAKQYRFVPYDEKNKEFDLVEAQKNGCNKKGILEETDKSNYIVFGEEYDSGGGGIISTPEDYSKFITALANYGLGLTGERILSPYGVDLLRTNSLTEHQKRTFNWKQFAGYGYGLGVRTMMDRIAGSSIGNIGEFGWCGAAGTGTFIDPEINLAAVYAKHTLNPREEYYLPRVRNVLYSCL